MIRKLALTGILVVAFDGSESHLIGSLFVTFVFILLHLQVNPYLNKGLNDFQRLALVSQFFTIFGCIIYLLLDCLQHRKLQDEPSQIEQTNKDLLAAFVFGLNIMVVAVYPLYRIWLVLQGSHFSVTGKISAAFTNLLKHAKRLLKSKKKQRQQDAAHQMRINDARLFCLENIDKPAGGNVFQFQSTGKELCSPPSQGGRNDNTSPCTNCGETILAMCKFCKFCGHLVSDSLTKDSTVEQNAPDFSDDEVVVCVCVCVCVSYTYLSYICAYTYVCISYVRIRMCVYHMCIYICVYIIYTYIYTYIHVHVHAHTHVHVHTHTHAHTHTHTHTHTYVYICMCVLLTPILQQMWCPAGPHERDPAGAADSARGPRTGTRTTAHRTCNVVTPQLSRRCGA